MKIQSIRTSTRKRGLTVFAGALVFACLWFWSELTTWRRLVHSSNNRLIETAEVVSLHADTILALADQALAELTLQAQTFAGNDDAAGRLADEMQRLVRTSHVLGGMSHIGVDGRLVSTTLDRMGVGLNASLEEAVRFHRASISDKIHIGSANRGDRDSAAFLPISKRIDGPNREFAGVMVAMVDLDEIARFMQSFNSGGDSSIFVLRGDGQVLMRYPSRGQAMKAGSFDSTDIRSLSTSDVKGRHDYQLPGSGSARLSGYFRNTETGITVVASRSRSALFHAWMSRSGYPWLGIGTAYIGVIIMSLRWIRQIRLRELGEQKIAAQELEFRLIANASTDIIEKITIDGIRLYVSAAARNLFQRPPEELVGTSIFEGMEDDAKAQWQTVLSRLNQGATSQSVLYRHQEPDGSTIWLESALSRLDNANGEALDEIVVITRDVTRQQTITQELDSLAMTDELTGLFNKRHFNNCLSSMFVDAADKRQPLSLVLIDLDRFKLFNDNYGHLAGDKALRAVAEVIQTRLQGTFGIAARYGGEELAVLLGHQNDMAVRAIAETIRSGVASLAIPHVGNLPFGHVTISAGHATIVPAPGGSQTELIAEADRALYLAKSDGRNQCRSHRELGTPNTLNNTG